MDKKILLLGIAFLAVIIGVFVFLFYFAQNAYLKEPEPQAYPVHFVDADVTITGVFLDELEHEYCAHMQYIGFRETGNICPADRITFTIDSLDRSGDSDNRVKVSEGDEMELVLQYSARPAKLLYELEPKCPEGMVYRNKSCVDENCVGAECAVGNPEFDSKPAEFDGERIIYYLPSTWSEKEEKIFPGLSEGMQIRIRIHEDIVNNIITEYEII